MLALLEVLLDAPLDVGCAEERPSLPLDSIAVLPSAPPEPLRIEPVGGGVTRLSSSNGGAHLI